MCECHRAQCRRYCRLICSLKAPLQRPPPTGRLFLYFRSTTRALVIPASINAFEMVSREEIGLSHNCSFFHSEGRVQEVRPSLCRKYFRCLLLLHASCQPSGSASAAADGAVAAATSEEA